MGIFTKTRITQAIITYSAFIVALLVLYVLIGRPNGSYLDRLKIELSTQTKKVSEYESLIRSCPNPEKEIETIEKKIQELESRAAGREIPRIIQQLASKTNEFSINTLSIRPRQDIKYSEEKLIKGVSKVYIEIVMLAPYKVIGEYLKALSQLPTILTIENVSIEKQEESSSGPTPFDNNELLVTLLLSAYMVLEI